MFSAAYEPMCANTTFSRLDASRRYASKSAHEKSWRTSRTPQARITSNNSQSPPISANVPTRFTALSRCGVGSSML